MSDRETAWCSWCFKRTEHELVQQNYVRRNVYQCQSCLNRTLICRFCDAAARGHETYDDEKCALCDGTIKKWGEKPTSKRGWCSWCFEQSMHRLIQANSVRRDVFECESCGRRSLPCRSCDGAFSRGHATWDDETCIKCDGTISSWARAKEEQPTLRRWCSWCFASTEHTLEQKNSVGRDVYTCSECCGRTLPCRGCEKGMTRGGPGWDDEHCAACDAEEPWSKVSETAHAAIEAKHSKAEIEKELSRQSEERKEALAAGMIRPFLYLASMDFASRNQIAQSLGWTLFNQDYLGDPHKEAWDIINASAKGIQARTNESWETVNPIADNCNWYETLFRVSTEVFKKCKFDDLGYSNSIAACRSSTDTKLQVFEEWYLEKMAQLQEKAMTEARIAEIDEFMDSDEVRDLAKRMKESGISSKAVIRYATNMVYQAIRMGGFNTYIMTVKIAAAINRNLGTKIAMKQAAKGMRQFAKGLNIVGWVWLAADVIDFAFGSSHGRLFAGVSQILNQRLFLAAEEIRIEDWY